MLAREWSKSFNLVFRSTWAENFCMYRLDLEKAEESEIKLTTSAGSQRRKGDLKKRKSICFVDYTKAFDCVDHNKLWKVLKEMVTRPPYLYLEKPVCRTRSNSYNLAWNNWLVQNWERNMSRLFIVTLLI